MSNSTICGQCLKATPQFDRTVAALRYQGDAIRLVHRFKFQGDLAVGAVLAQLMVRAVGPDEGVDALIPVPLATSRRRERGFDQALELARMMARSMDIDVVRNAARRTGNRCPQSTLTSWDERRRNVRGVFHVEQKIFSGARVAIVDDVMTSGATADALARALRQAGASSVLVWVACRAGLGP